MLVRRCTTVSDDADEVDHCPDPNTELYEEINAGLQWPPCTTPFGPCHASGQPWRCMGMRDCRNKMLWRWLARDRNADGM